MEEMKKQSSFSATMSSVSYALIMVLIGVPVWWKTTQVYRVALPYKDMEASYKQMNIRVNVNLVTSDTHRDHQLGPKIQQLLTPSRVFDFSLSGRAPTQEEIRVTKEAAGSHGHLDELLKPMHANVLAGTVILFEVPVNFARTGGGARGNVVVGENRCVFFNRNASMEELVAFLRDAVLGEKSLIKLAEAAAAASSSSREEEAAVAKQNGGSLRAPSGGGYDILFSLLVPEPEQVTATEAAKMAPAVERFVQPFLRSLENLSEFNVKSQVRIPSFDGARHKVDL